jgi:hypothetical protein
MSDNGNAADNAGENDNLLNKTNHIEPEGNDDYNLP